MFSPFSITCFVLAASAIAAGGGYGLVAGNDQGGSALFFVVGIASAVLAVAAAALGARDAAVAPVEPTTSTSSASPAAAASPARRPLDPTPEVRGSSWPLLSALALALVAAGFATDAPILVIGLVAVVLTSIGWLGQVWREHPAWNRAYDERITDRYLLPFALPIATIVGVAVLAVALSRLLLAVSEKAAPLIAIVLAITLLAAFAVLATRPLGRNGSLAFAVAGALFVAASGIGGAVAGEREFHHEPDASAEGGEHGTDDEHGTDGDRDNQESEAIEHGDAEDVAIELVAKDIAFDANHLQVPAGAHVTVTLRNEDRGVPHNVSFYVAKGGKAVETGEIIDGVAATTTKVDFQAPEGGALYFQCDVHPDMSGELVVA